MFFCWFFDDTWRYLSRIGVYTEFDLSVFNEDGGIKLMIDVAPNGSRLAVEGIDAHGDSHDGSSRCVQSFFVDVMHCHCLYSLDLLYNFCIRCPSSSTCRSTCLVVYRLCVRPPSTMFRSISLCVVCVALFACPSCSCFVLLESFVWICMCIYIHFGVLDIFICL